VIYTQVCNLTSSFYTNTLKLPLNIGQNVCVLYEIVVAKSVTGDKFVTGNRINVLTAHLQTLLSQKSLKIASYN